MTDYRSEYRDTPFGTVYGFWDCSGTREIIGLFYDMELRESILLRRTPSPIPIQCLLTTSNNTIDGFVVDSKAGEKAPSMFRDLTDKQLTRFVAVHSLPLEDLQVIRTMAQDATKTPNRT